VLSLDQTSSTSVAAAPVKITSMTAFSEGQYVELYPTIPSSSDGSVDAGMRGIVREIDMTRPGEEIYLVAFLRNERPTGEEAWLREADLFRA
jgi:hypothetical protein